MIVNTVADVMAQVIGGVWDSIPWPDVSIPTPSGFIPWYSTLDRGLPLSECFTYFGILLLVAAAVFLWKVLSKVLSGIAGAVGGMAGFL